MGGKRYSVQERAALVDLFSKRTGSIKSFIEAHGVSAATLYKWRGNTEDTGGGFVEIARTEAHLSALLLVRVGGLELRFEQLPDAGWLAGLLQKLQG